jgi:hypothetical protein
MVQPGQKLPGAACDIVLCFKDFDGLFDRNFQAGLEAGPSLHPDSAPLDEVLRFGDFRDPALNQKEVESHFHK